MNLVARAKGILTSPREEWPLIDAEPLDLGELLTKYVLPLAAIGPIATFIGWSAFGMGIFRIPVGTAFMMAITSYILAIAGLFLVAWIANALAPSFGATQSMPQAIKLIAYASTAAWVAGIFGLIPALSIIAVIGGLYTLYLCYLGIPVLMKAPADKAMVYTIVIIV
ncbi:MAG TPA: Yip1 family protein, partial [Gemmatimonadaceae bacterium]|nr:Yip1 family protein [Gemmatimonadaceae bacterium]